MRENQLNISGKKILITGFGPFGNHIVNASWEAVKELSKLWPQSELCNIQLITKQIPVSYEYVSTEISKLWEEHNPVIVIHVGVSYKASCLTIEHIAHSTGYARPDINDFATVLMRIHQKVDAKLAFLMMLEDICANIYFINH
ncbi:pyroglutamyl-peptidase 1 isoform X2 [Vespa crabro]|uniref:pyroglutamyl-peptidase 1 isoform X2 n=1 Tax=Vespa crabro TaxID=7445 RepID=UPI001F01C6F8|nr:pyroglutamyl-peptidase 1 isoform X2 [Vespa crabro]